MIHLRTLLAAPAAALAAALTLAACVAPEPVVTEETIQRVIKSSFNTTEYNYPPEVIARLDSDEGQKMCSAVRNEIAKLPPAQLNDFIAKSRKEIRFPAKLMGDWKQGERIAQNGVGLRFGMSPDKPGQPNGGNCYACHQVSPQELSFGTVGPSLLGYGKQRGAGVESQKFVYEKVYNAWLYFPCSNMPRFGHHGVLTPEQITHLVALLLDPASPVNK
jgi:sulfur-oxidizing protein SoxX